MAEVLLVVACLALILPRGCGGDRRHFARRLVRTRCPWCHRGYGAEAARRALADQGIYARAFAVRCLRCGRVQILTGGPSVEEWRARHGC